MNDFIKSGYRVIGPNTSNGEITSWFFDNEDLANKFAAHVAQSVLGYDIEVCKFISSFRTDIPVKQTKATDI